MILYITILSVRMLYITIELLLLIYTAAICRMRKPSVEHQ